MKSIMKKLFFVGVLVVLHVINLHGQVFYKEITSSTFQKYGILFENRSGADIKIDSLAFSQNESSCNNRIPIYFFVEADSTLFLDPAIENLYYSWYVREISPRWVLKKRNILNCPEDFSSIAFVHVLKSSRVIQKDSAFHISFAAGDVACVTKQVSTQSGYFPADTLFLYTSAGVEHILFNDETLGNFCVANEAGPVVQDFQLKASPNPFNPSTKVSFTLPSVSQVNLVVSDITGKIVRVLADHVRFASGSHTLGFDAGGLASGVYIVMLKTPDGRTQSTKLTLLK